MYSLEKRPQSLFNATSCAFCFYLIFTGGLLNSGNLFFGTVCVTGVVHRSSLSITNLEYCCLPRVSIFLTVSATWVSMMSLVPMARRSWLCSRNGFPISSSTVHRMSNTRWRHWHFLVMVLAMASFSKTAPDQLWIAFGARSSFRLIGWLNIALRPISSYMGT